MNRIHVDNLKYGNITFFISDKKDGIIITFKGLIDMEYPQLKLDAYFDQLHTALINNKIKAVYCDLKELSYTNSSGIRCIVKWIMKLVNMKDIGNKYAITFIINKDYEWQATSLGFLANLDPGLILIKK